MNRRGLFGALAAVVAAAIGAVAHLRDVGNGREIRLFVNGRRTRPLQLARVTSNDGVTMFLQTERANLEVSQGETVSVQIFQGDDCWSGEFTVDAEIRAQGSDLHVLWSRELRSV